MLVYTVMPLYDEPFYSYDISLNKVSYHIKFIFNQQNNLYTLNLYTSDKTPIVEGVSLVPNYPLLDNLVHEGWTGFLYMATIADKDNEYYVLKPQELSKYYELRFYFDDGK